MHVMHPYGGRKTTQLLALQPVHMHGYMASQQQRVVWHTTLVTVGDHERLRTVPAQATCGLCWM